MFAKYALCVGKRIHVSIQTVILYHHDQMHKNMLSKIRCVTRESQKGSHQDHPFPNTSKAKNQEKLLLEIQQLNLLYIGQKYAEVCI